MKRISFEKVFASAIIVMGFILSLGGIQEGLAIPYEVTQIDFPGASSTRLGGINDGGQVVGYYWDGAYQYGFFLDGSQFTSIDFTLTGNSMTAANGINNSGQIVGTVGWDARDGYLLSNGVYSQILVLGANSVTAQGINDMGQIVGFYGTFIPEITDHSYLYSNGNFIWIDVPGATGTMGTQAMGINNNGEIVGRYRSSTDVVQGFLYSGGTYTTIDFPGAERTELYDINDLGDIIGSYRDVFGVHPFLYDDGLFTALDLPGTPSGINDRGQIVGYYSDSSGEHGFLATPVPEPSTILLFCSGLSGAYFLRKRFRRRNS